MAQNRRTIVRQPAFEECCRKLKASIRRIDEYLEAIEWAFERDPAAFPLIPGTSVRVVRIEASQEFPTLRVFVGMEGEKWSWEFMEIVEEDDDGDGVEE